jgi:hypothetical protein
VTYADARNLCLKRREAGGVKMADTPQTQNGMVWGLSSPNVGKRCPQGTRRRGGSYGSLASLVLELGNSHTAIPTLVGHENANVREGGRRRRSSQRPDCNGLDTVKVRQAWCTEPTGHTRTWGTFTKGSLCATSDLVAVAGSLHKRAASNHHAGKRSASKGARSVWKGGKTVKSYLSLPDRVCVPQS